MLAASCTFFAICLFILGSSGNGLCILVFLRKKFRFRMITPYFIILLFADSIYLLFRLMKLLYYSQTLFKLHINITNTTNLTNTEGLCSSTFLVRIFQRATQNWPQLFIPFVHSETYMRFSLILMSIMSIQRTAFITRSLKFLVLPSTFKETYKYKWTILIIFSAFFLAYIFECAGLTLFCSEYNNQQITYEWFIYMNKYMENSSSILLNTMIDQPKSYRCVQYASNILQQNQTLIFNSKSPCTEDELMNILSHHFDQHQRPIVNLIQKITYYQTGRRITKNEIRRKYHFHECLFPLKPSFFHQFYDLMYSRVIGLNRHTLLLVFGSILPSLITIISNIISVLRVQELNRLTSIYILPCRRRTDDTRRILLVITVECLFAVVNSWFSDILLSIIYCQGNIAAGDDCPMYLRQSYGPLVMFDLVNSVSNIILHCVCGKRFRNELKYMLQSIMNFLKHIFHNIWCCYFQINLSRQTNEPCVSYNASISRHESSNSSNSVTHNYLYLRIHRSTRSTSRFCCDCRWYVNRKPLITKDQLGLSRTHQAVRYVSLTQRTDLTRPLQTQSMRLYYPPQNISIPTRKKPQYLNRH